MAKVKIEWTETVQHEVEVEIPYETLPEGWREDAALLRLLDGLVVEHSSPSTEAYIAERSVDDVTLVSADAIPSEIRAPKHEPMW